MISKMYGEKRERGARSRSSVGPRSRTRTGVSTYTYLPKAEYQSRMAAYRRELAQARTANATATAAYVRCRDAAGGLSCPQPPTADGTPEAPNIRQAGDPATPVAPALTPQEVAYIATARLRLTAPTPGIGPSPDLNRWKMAAVGYPLWLWVDGATDPAPVSDSVADLSVSLDARLTSVVFDMGDGHEVTCAGVTTRWTRAVRPGQTSPSCGYAYPDPSLPEDSYTVTAHAVWAIDWTINGTTGTIPLYQSASTTIPVGELQVLVR